MKKLFAFALACTIALSAGAREEMRGNFYGLQMGEPATQAEVEEAMEDHAVFIEDFPEGEGHAYRFGYMEFDGFEWNLCTVATTDDDLFYYFAVECDWPTDDEEGALEAESMFEILKAMYDGKYGDGEYMAEGSDEYMAYYGSNGVALLLSDYVSVSNGGERRRYLSVTFVLSELA